MIKNFYILDVFAEKMYSGNQLAVVLATGGLADEDMQNIAREFNCSETSFILSSASSGGGYDVRIFTPRAEVPFAGHPTLGAAYIIQSELIGEPVDEVVLNLRVGQIPVRFHYTGNAAERLVMRQNEPVFGEEVERAKVSEVISLKPDDIDGRFPVQVVSTGLPFLVVPLRGLEALKRARVNNYRYYGLIKDIEAKAILVFSPEPHLDENDLSVRMFADYYGIAEDPATGSGCGCLGAYLLKNVYMGRKGVSLRVEQGYEIGRPSLLFLDAEDVGGNIEVHVGGRVIRVASGVLG